MKRYILTGIAIACAGFSLAQSLRGGFGHGYFGAAYNISPGIEKDLQVSSLLGNDLQLNRLARFGGGGGYALFGNRILLGGSGFGYRVSDATARGQATLTMGGGFVNIGYLTVYRDNILGFPYAGIGGKGLKAKIKNNTSDESFNIGNRVIRPGEYINLYSGGISFELGYALKFLTFSVKEPGGHGGFMVGVQAGTYIFTGMEDWHEKSSDDVIANFATPYSFSPYLRITIGGGGFSVSEE